MNRRALFFLLAIFSLSNALISAQFPAEELNAPYINGYENECECSYYFPLPQRISIGPEIYHVRRTREGGTKQSGTLYGVRATYDRIKRYKIYWGGDFLWAKGTLKGKSGIGDRLKSTFTDEQIEGRLGYTFQQKSCYQPSLTPFIGYGYFRETNKYHHPSPMRLKFQNRFQYFTFGFFSSLAINPCLNVGFNFRAKAMIHARCRVSNDPEIDNFTMQIGERMIYRYELPILYRNFCIGENFELGVVPFYETRHYAGKDNFPFNFLDTKLRLYGVNLQFAFRF